MLRSIALTVAFVLLPISASAASGDTTVGSGVTVDSVLEQLSPYVTQTAPPQTGLVTTMEQAAIDQIEERRLDARHTCRTRLRKASATTRFSILKDCVVDDLLSQKAGLDRLADAIATSLAVTELERASAVWALTAEVDALDALIDGMENGVYGTEADLQKARQRLVQKYSAPRWLSLTRLRADRALHWAAWLAASLRPANSGSGATIETIDPNLITCLARASDTLFSVTTEEHDVVIAHERLDAGLDTLASCAL